LQKVPSITQPLLTPAGYTVAANAGDAGTQGIFEIVHTRNPQTDSIATDIVAAFTMPATFVGTPKVMIVSAARDKLVNDVPKGGRRMLDEDPAGPMFYVIPTITRVDADYSNDVYTAVKIVGRGFNTRDTSSMVFGPDPLKLNPNESIPLAEGEYRVLASGAIIEALVKRDRNFPQWSIDYVSQSGKQVLDATFTRDDTIGPAVFDKTRCTFTPDTPKDGKVPVKLSVAGKFLVNSMVPSLAVAGQTLPPGSFTQQFVSANQWDFTATIPAGASQIAVTLTPTTKNLGRAVLCFGPVVDKAQKPEAAEKKGLPKQEMPPVAKNPKLPAAATRQ
jgi:hypothetical protein